jgi:GT2 family glycosyltransferase
MPEPDLTIRAPAAGQTRAKWSSRRTLRARLLQALWVWREKGARHALKRAFLRLGYATLSYRDWIKINDTLSPKDLAQIRGRIKRMARQPLISLVLFIEEPTAAALRRAIDSVTAQLYDNWELRIAGYDANAADLGTILDDYVAADARIKLVATTADDFMPAANAALADCAGDFVGFVAVNDQLASHALYMLAEEINSCPEANLIYTDEDAIDDQGRRSSPQFKTDWNPDLFLSQNYLGQLTVYRRDLVAPTGFRAGFEGCEDYDFALRAIEQLAPATIRHIPFVLVHRNMPTVEAAKGSDITPRARRAVQDHLNRLGIRATVGASRSGNYNRVRRLLPEPPPRVSIIIPTRDRVEILRGAIESILKHTNYPNFEIVIVDNQSIEPEALSYLASLGELPQVRVLRFDHAFNHSAINNFATGRCQSPLFAFLNNDLLVINGDWLTEMVSQAMRPEVGAVGAMLYYPDDVIQHAGILLGLGGVAANCYSRLERGSTGYFCRAELMQNYSAVTAACLVTRAEVFAEVGGFNENDLPAPFNDVDYCLRLRERGYLVTWTPYAELYHLESVSRGDDMSPNKVDRFNRDRAYMARRWAHLLSNDPYYSPNLSLDEMPFTLSASSRVSRPWRSDG